ncbi:amidase [Derxia gummosa]|uniref:Amidase n=1 Tax=Derxia gummosa DSM 723 TaxID=1121388 RepID=A0A8B6X7W7_9BURK|nr:amidase [Derxia gummosa]
MTIVVHPLDSRATGPAVMVKDTIDVAGAPTRAGSRALEGRSPATAHAEVVALLLGAGWRLTGKTNLHELAYGTTGINHHTGTPVNPAAPDRVPGGSSCGSAVAVASGLVPVALGTDTGGSVRIPAACCGVFGFKPTFGRVSRAGVMPAETTLDCVGPLARDMDALIDVMRVIAPGFGACKAPAGITLGVVAVEAAPAVAAAVAGAIAASDCSTVPVTLARMDAAYAAGLAVINAETWAACGELVATGLVGADVARRLANASRTTPGDVAAANLVREGFAAEIDAALARCTVLALPTMADVPPLLADAADTSAAVAMTTLVRPFNLSGHPALHLPLRTADGLPAGLQLVGPKGADELVCAVGRELSRRLRLSSLA